MKNCPNANQGRGGPCNGHCCPQTEAEFHREFRYQIYTGIAVIFAVGCVAVLVMWAI